MIQHGLIIYYMRSTLFRCDLIERMVKTKQNYILLRLVRINLVKMLSGAIVCVVNKNVPKAGKKFHQPLPPPLIFSVAL